jgi:hypothetical protein
MTFRADGAARGFVGAGAPCPYIDAQTELGTEEG